MHFRNSSDFFGRRENTDKPSTQTGPPPAICTTREKPIAAFRNLYRSITKNLTISIFAGQKKTLFRTRLIYSPLQTKRKGCKFHAHKIGIICRCNSNFTAIKFLFDRHRISKTKKNDKKPRLMDSVSARQTQQKTPCRSPKLPQRAYMTGDRPPCGDRCLF